MSGFLGNVDWREIAQACLDTLAMLGGSLVLTILLGLPLGIILFLTSPGQVWAHRAANGVLVSKSGSGAVGEVSSSQRQIRAGSLARCSTLSSLSRAAAT